MIYKYDKEALRAQVNDELKKAGRRLRAISIFREYENVILYKTKVDSFRFLAVRIHTPEPNEVSIVNICKVRDRTKGISYLFNGHPHENLEPLVINPTN